MNKQGQRSTKEAIEMFSVFRSIETQRSKFRPISSNKSQLSKYVNNTSCSPIFIFFNDLWHRKMTLKTRIVLYLTFHSKSIQIPRTFYGCFHFGLTYPLLISTKLNNSSEVTLLMEFLMLIHFP